MFPAEQPDQWDPHKIRRKPRKTQDHAQNGDTVVPDTAEPEFEEDLESDEGAVWPIQSGRITNWPCFYALLQYIHNTLSPTLHTPILMIAEPVWTAKDHEKITQYCFESFKCPGFVLLDAAQAAAYAFGLQTACVVDVGAEKANVTTITDFLLDHSTRAVAVSGCGGDALTTRLQELLSSKGFTKDMCEQLKKNPICEVLLPGTPLPAAQATTHNDGKNPASIASTGAEGSGADQRHTAGALGEAPRGPGPGTEVGGDGQDDGVDNDGVLDVASIVASGKMNEYLARKEKEKQEKVAAKADKKKGEAAKAEAAKNLKMKNSDREKATFFYEDHALLNVLKRTNMDGNGIAEAKAALDEGPTRKHSINTTTQPISLDTTTTTNPLSAAIDTISPTGTNPTTAPRREITVGTERFQAASGPNSPLITLSSTIHRVITSCPTASLRSDLWNNLIIVGNGAAVRGFKEALVATLTARFLVNPSLHLAGNGSSMFTGELPSQLGTPSGTGANTPIPGGNSFIAHSFGGGAGGSGGANPLLVAATNASAQAVNEALAVPSGLAANLPAQTPSAMRLARLPDYFPEWKEAGSDEAAFLGAQIAAKMVFVIDQSAGGGKGYMTRNDYNEQGPGGVHEFSM